MHYSAVQYSLVSVQYSTVQHSIAQHSTAWMCEVYTQHKHMRCPDQCVEAVSVERQVIALQSPSCVVRRYACLTLKGLALFTNDSPFAKALDRAYVTGEMRKNKLHSFLSLSNVASDGIARQCVCSLHRIWECLIQNIGRLWNLVISCP